MIFKQHGRIKSLRMGVTLALCTSGFVHAAVIDTAGSVDTAIQELVNGTPASATTALDELNIDQTNFPLVASGQLTTTDLAGQIISLGQGLSEFDDPTRLDQPNPESFALETACYSNSTEVSYIVTSSARESRTVLFAGLDNPNVQQEIQFRDDQTREIESQVFLSGAVILWSTDAAVDLNGLLADMVVTVTNENTNAVLFNTSITVDIVNEEIIRTVTAGPILFELVELDDFLSDDIDEQSATVLQEVAQTGTLVILVIPQQSHTYSYTVTADEPLVLTAQLDLFVRNVPGGTGIAATLGRPFANLASFIQAGLPGVNGLIMEKSLNEIIVQSDADLDDKPENQLLPGFPLCGAFGVEMMILGFICLCIRWVPGFGYHIQ